MNLIRKIGRLLFGSHEWHRPRNGNPWVRICAKCGRHEIWQECSIEGNDWVEVYPLAHSPEKCNGR